MHNQYKNQNSTKFSYLENLTLSGFFSVSSMICQFHFCWLFHRMCISHIDLQARFSCPMYCQSRISFSSRKEKKNPRDEWYHRGRKEQKRSTAIVSVWYQTALEQSANKLENEEEAQRSQPSSAFYSSVNGPVGTHWISKDSWWLKVSG